MSIIERIKEIDFNKFDLNEEEKEIIYYAKIELAIRLGDIETVKQYIKKYHKFTIKSPEQELHTYEIADDFEQLVGNDEKIYSNYYVEILSILKSPFDLQDDSELDPIIMLFVIALEEADVKLYVNDYIKHLLIDVTLLSLAYYSKNYKNVELFLTAGVPISEDDYYGNRDNIVQTLFQKKMDIEVDKHIVEKVFKDNNASPTFCNIVEWVKKYHCLYLFKSSLISSNCSFIKLESIYDIYFLISMNMYYPEGIVFLARPCDQSEIKLIMDEVEKSKQTNKDTNKMLISLINELLIFFIDHKLKLDENYQRAILNPILKVNSLNIIIPSPNIYDSSRTEADFWSEIYEHQKEYNDNH